MIALKDLLVALKNGHEKSCDVKVNISKGQYIVIDASLVSDIYIQVKDDIEDLLADENPYNLDLGCFGGFLSKTLSRDVLPDLKKILPKINR